MDRQNPPTAGCAVMKPNPVLSHSDDAASEVVGIILLVSTVVILATGIFLVLKRLEGSNNQPPAIGFMTDNADREIQVIKAPVAPDVIRYAPGPSDSGMKWVGECTVDRVNGVLVNNTMIVKAGDAIHTTCTSGQTINLVDSVSGTTRFTAKFS